LGQFDAHGFAASCGPSIVWYFDHGSRSRFPFFLENFSVIGDGAPSFFFCISPTSAFVDALSSPYYLYLNLQVGPISVFALVPPRSSPSCTRGLPFSSGLFSPKSFCPFTSGRSRFLHTTLSFCHPTPPLQILEITVLFLILVLFLARGVQ